MIIDVHAHAYPSQDIKELLTALERYEINRIYISNPNTPGGYYPSEDQVSEQNRMTLGIVKQCPEKFRYVPFVNPVYDSSVDIIKRAIEDNDAKAIKLWVATTCDSPHVDKIAELSIKYNVPILIHAFHKHVGLLPDESTGFHVANLAKRYPESKLIMAHMGGNAYHGIKYVKGLPNVWTDISRSNHRSGEIEYTVKHLGEDRVLFGTDAYMVLFHTNIGKLNEADISKEAKEKIFWKNAVELFGEEL